MTSNRSSSGFCSALLYCSVIVYLCQHYSLFLWQVALITLTTILDPFADLETWCCILWACISLYLNSPKPTVLHAYECGFTRGASCCKLFLTPPRSVFFLTNCCIMVAIIALCAVALQSVSPLHACFEQWSMYSFTLILFTLELTGRSVPQILILNQEPPKEPKMACASQVIGLAQLGCTVHTMALAGWCVLIL